MVCSFTPSFSLYMLHQEFDLLISELVIAVHLVIWSSESSQMILDLKKHGSSCHWIPSLYLVDGIHAIWSLFEVELAILEVWWCWLNICPLVVEDCKTSLIVELLKAVDCESTRVLHVLELAGLQTFVVVRLSLARRASPVGNDLLCSSQNPSWEFFWWGKSPAPECESAWNIGRWDSLVSVGPEPGTSSLCF